MARRSNLSNVSSPAMPPADNGIPAKAPEIADLLVKAEELLQAGQPEKAMHLVARAKLKSPWVINALGVCQLRLGNAKAAVDAFRGLVLAPGGIVLRNDIPAVFKANYATALLADNNISGCLRVLAEVNESEHRAVSRLRSAIQCWKEGLTLWQKLSWYTGGLPNRPIKLDFPPGDIE